MTVSVAEYYGQRTDVDDVNIQPNLSRDGRCPFSASNVCKKLKSGNAPVCAVRKSDGTLWIVCSERLCATKKDLPLCQHQINILLNIGKTIFGNHVLEQDICIKREENITVVEGTKYHADYIMTLSSGYNPAAGPNRLILELQGGGETSNTGSITNHLSLWANNNVTNNFMRQQVNAGTLETNAWRRQQEQFIVKGNIAMKTWKGYGIAFCVGTLLYDYLMHKLQDANLPNLQNYNWTLAIIAIKEDTSQPINPGPIPLIVDETRLLFTNYQTFVQALINQGEPSLDAFRGTFINLENQQIHIQHP